MTVESRDDIDALTRVGRVVAVALGEYTMIVTRGAPVVLTTYG